jgi:hypothetical protein
MVEKVSGFLYENVILGGEVMDLVPPKGLNERSLLLRGLNYRLETVSL